jgi:hypothetical protein
MELTMKLFHSRLIIALFIALSFLVGTRPGFSRQTPSFRDGHPVIVGIDATARYYNFKSAINGRAYRIFVSIPDRAPPKDGFPVIYLLDGNRNFAMTSDSLGGRSQARDLKPAIVVGIGYPTNHSAEMSSLRTKDLTTPISANRLKKLEQLDPGNPYTGLTSDAVGGVDVFLHVIEQEIKPFVARLAPVDSSDQVFFGHSLAGLTVVHALFTEPTAFQTFIASSPSIWWDEKAVLRDEPGFAREVTTGQIAPRILIDVGGLEQTPEGLPPGAPPGAAREAQMVGNAVSLGKRLAALKGGRCYVVKTVVFAGETHLSVVPAAISRGLGFALAMPGRDLGVGCR